MFNMIEPVQEAARPRLIVWQLAPRAANDQHPDSLHSQTLREEQQFSAHECMMTIDSIARTAKPIVVFTGKGILRRADLYEIVEYGVVLTVPNNGVGGYDNNMQDLIANFCGSISFLLLRPLFVRLSHPPPPGDTKR